MLRFDIYLLDLSKTITWRNTFKVWVNGKYVPDKICILDRERSIACDQKTIIVYLVNPVVEIRWNFDCIDLLSTSFWWVQLFWKLKVTTYLWLSHQTWNQDFFYQNKNLFWPTVRKNHRKNLSEIRGFKKIQG